ncbi:ABC transporter permease [Entomobacter blattae]|uniref:Branched-chain amino acid transport system / permease component n=1 Tax=Entomobacter blattae TaxID=2762277 RepID=A0A7H1NU81_9PROT|nr:ABC transporter permease [Entomobacter blattae]QNT79341.1 Branched-chain amino acid transport system / permease component [Entomobacter blattae]
MSDQLTNLLMAAVLAGSILSLAALGELISELVGVINLGVEGIMSLGAVMAIIVVFAIPSPWLGLGVALLTGMVCGIIFVVATVIIRANQILIGLAMTMLGVGLASFIGHDYAGMPAPATFHSVHVPILYHIPFIGPAFFGQDMVIYFAYFLIPLAIWIVFFKTRHGLNIRAVGEAPAAADSVGVRVKAVRCCYVIAGSGLAGMAGGYLTLSLVPSWSEGMIAGRGWIAVALVILGHHRPFLSVLASLFFGLVTVLSFVGQAKGWPISSFFLDMLPYLLTVFLVIVSRVFRRKNRHDYAPPAALGQPFMREMR